MYIIIPYHSREVMNFDFYLYAIEQIDTHRLMKIKDNR